jgi:endonuclease/exonuclease/phosphatase family metal-dependent hydrolase
MLNLGLTIKNMKRNFITLSLSLFIFIQLSCNKNKTIAITDLKVLTYNVAGLPELFSSSKPTLYTTEISKLINEYDVVHVQEDFCYHDSLLLYNKHPHRTETLGCIPAGDGLNTLSYFPIQNFKRIKWNDCADTDCLTPKGFSYSQIEIYPGVTVDFYNVHANAQSYEEALAARRKNITQLCAYIAENSADKPVVIMGDMNCRYTREGDNIREVLALGFSDSWIELIRKGDIPAQGADALTDCNTVKTSTTCEKVDKIFYRSSPKVNITPTYFQMDDDRYYYNGNDTLPLSDHYPVLTKLKFEIKE